MYAYMVVRWICLLVVLLDEATVINMQLFDSLSRGQIQNQLGNWTRIFRVAHAHAHDSSINYLSRWSVSLFG